MKVQCLLGKYNNGKYFCAAIESLASQSVPYTSILVSENYSTDGSSQLAEDAAKQFKNVTSCSPPKHVPSGDNYAFLLEQIEPDVDYIHIASSDDIWERRFLERMTNFIQRGPAGIAAVFCDRIYVDQQNRPLGASGNLRLKPFLEYAGFEAFRHFAKGNSYNIMGALFRADIVRSYIDLCRQSGDAGDWIIMLEAARQGAVGYLGEALYRYRVHDSNSSRTPTPYEDRLKNYIAYLEKRDPEACRILREIRKTVSEKIQAKPAIKDPAQSRAAQWAKLVAHKIGFIKAARQLKWGRMNS